MSRIVVFFIVALALVVTPINSSAQTILGLKLESITVGSGEDPLSSGITGVADFGSSNGKIFGEFVVQPEQAWAILARNIEHGNFSATIGGSVGHFQAAPYIGPYLFTGFALSQNVKLTGLYWPALFAWEPYNWKNDDRPTDEDVAIGNFGIVGIELGNDYKIKFNVAGLNFMNDPTNWLPGGSVTVPIANQISWTSAATRNRNGEAWMFYMGITKTFGT